MTMNERIYKIDQILSERRCVKMDELIESLQVSRATLKRDLAMMRDRLNAPIVFDRELGGYRFDKSNPPVGGVYELPGLWFSSDEIYALLTMHHLISNLDAGGLLAPHIQPLQARLTALLGAANDSIEAVRKRVKIEMVGARPIRVAHFEAVGAALLKRKCIQISYYRRYDGSITEREISPLRLVYYQGNWYLGAWCHLKNDLRIFSVDAIRRVEILGKRAKDIPEKTLNENFGAGYGIFFGGKEKWATLVFSEEAARWVSSERWHARQQGRFLADGRYELKLPYSYHQELMMNVLRYGARVQVLRPKSLVDTIRKEIGLMAEVYRLDAAEPA